MILLISTVAGLSNSPLRAALMRLAVFWNRLRYWTYGGIFEASRIAWRGDTALPEFFIGAVTLLVGLWWAIFPQPLTNVFGRIDSALPWLPASLVFGLLMGAAGRNVLHRLVEGSPHDRCKSVRICAGVWIFLTVNQLLLSWMTMGTVIFGFNIVVAYWIHERICPSKRHLRGGGCCPNHKRERGG